jgi:DNA-binding transcriptional ArsR family regulator
MIQPTKRRTNRNASQSDPFPYPIVMILQTLRVPLATNSASLSGRSFNTEAVNVDSMSDIFKQSDKALQGAKFEGSQRFDEILTALSNTQRRRILRYLQEVDSASRDEVVHHLIAWKRDSPPDDVSDEAVERLKIELHHNHLPRLEESRLVEYDRRTEELLVRDLPELAEQCLEHCETADTSP